MPCLKKAKHQIYFSRVCEMIIYGEDIERAKKTNHQFEVT